MQAAIIVIRGNSDDSAGTMNKKCPQLLVATRVLSWNQTRPYGKVTAIFKFGSFASRGKQQPWLF